MNVKVYSLPNWDKGTIEDRNCDLIKELIRLYPYERSIDKNVYDEQMIKNRTLPRMDKLLEWGIVSKGDELCLARYKDTSKAILLDADTVLFNEQSLKVSQWIFKIYGITTGINSYREIFKVGGADSLDTLRNAYMKEHPIEFDNAPSDLDAEVFSYKKVESTFVVYDEQYHLEGVTEDVKKWYNKLKNEAFDICGEMEPIATKLYVA